MRTSLKDYLGMIGQSRFVKGECQPLYVRVEVEDLYVEGNSVQAVIRTKDGFGRAEVELSRLLSEEQVKKAMIDLERSDLLKKFKSIRELEDALPIFNALRTEVAASGSGIRETLPTYNRGDSRRELNDSYAILLRIKYDGASDEDEEEY